uniref:Uncharacterized protein n=1 Tax=Clastoptera arizonana TaxID=38151 RepID=A0A1B6DQN9_9HEMI
MTGEKCSRLCHYNIVALENEMSSRISDINKVIYAVTKSVETKMDKWQGRVAVVTGASAGIGEEIARELVKQGLVVVGLARRVERVQELSKELGKEKGKLHALKADLRNEQDILDAFSWIEQNLGGVDVLVNNAGALAVDTITEGTREAFRSVLELNVLGLTSCSREAVKLMKKKGADDGVIINVNSVAGQKVMGIPFYTATKFAVRSLSEALNKELRAAGSKIRVTNLSPGAVKTDIFPMDKLATLKISAEAIKQMETEILLPSDIAESVVYILSTDKRVYIPELTIQQNFEVRFNPGDLST